MKAQPDVVWYALILFLIAITNVEQGLIAKAYTIEWVLFLITSIGLASRYRESLTEREKIRGAYFAGQPVRPQRSLLEHA